MHFYFAQILLQEVWTFHRLIGSYSLIVLKILKHIFIELEELQDIRAGETDYFSLQNLNKLLLKN